MKLEFLKSRVLNSFTECCANNLHHEIKAAHLIRLLQEKNLVLDNTDDKRALGRSVIDEIPNLIVGLTRASTKLVATEGYLLKSIHEFVKDIENHLPYLRNIKALSA